MAGSILETLEYVAGPSNCKVEEEPKDNSSKSRNEKTREMSKDASFKTPRESRQPNLSAWSAEPTISTHHLRSTDLEEISRIIKSALQTLMLPEIKCIQRRLEEPACRGARKSRRNSDPLPSIHGTTLLRLPKSASVGCVDQPDMKSGSFHMEPLETNELHPDQTSDTCELVSEEHSARSVSCGSLRRKLMNIHEPSARHRLEELIAEIEESQANDRSHTDSKLKTVKSGICTITKKSQYISEAERRALDTPKNKRWSDVSRIGTGRVHAISKTFDTPHNRASKTTHSSQDVQSSLTNENLVKVLQCIQEKDQESKVRDDNISHALMELRDEIKELPGTVEQKTLHTSEAPETPRDDHKTSKSTCFLTRFKSTRGKEYERLEVMMSDLLRGVDNIREDLKSHKAQLQQEINAKKNETSIVTNLSIDAEQSDFSKHTLPKDYFVKLPEAAPKRSDTPPPRVLESEDEFEKCSRPSFAEQATDELLRSLTDENKLRKAAKHKIISVRKPRGARQMTDGRDWASSSTDSLGKMMRN